MHSHSRILIASLGLAAAIAALVGAARLSLAPAHDTAPASDMVLVPAGEFIMGSETGDPDERPRRTVYLEALYIDKYEITNTQYVQFLEAGGGPAGRCGGHICLDPQAEDPDSHIFYQRGRYVVEKGYLHHPVTNVSWYGAQAFCRHHGKRLPTEAEWEKAARGTDGRRYPWGNVLDPTKLNADQRAGDTVPVGSYPGGASPYGLHDLAGNVWEWTADWYKAYPGNRHHNAFFGQKYKVVRGGSWNHPDSDARATHRDIAHPTRRIHVVGFRCAREP